MEGRASTFKKVLADFESRLPGAEFVAIDTELTGVDIAGEPDTFEESTQERLDKNCRIAERYTLIQLGLTIVGRVPDSKARGHLTCSSYNLFAFPYIGGDVRELVSHDPCFLCNASALRFNAQHRVDFNKWICEGIPYMSREDERRYLLPLRENGGADRRSTQLEDKIGLLLLWKALCNAKVPFVVHCPLDLFFLLAAFEKRPLPREDPRALAMMIRQCTPKVYDTAHLHGAIGHFRRLGLVKFYEDAKARYEELKESGNVAAVEFHLQGETAQRYSRHHDELAHEAGFDSLMTAQLFAYLRAISPKRVEDNANCLFLFRSVEYFDLNRAVAEGQVGTSMFDPQRVTLLVAAIDPLDGSDAARHITQAGSQYRKLDANHLLVVLRASGGAAVRKAADLAMKVNGVRSWMGFDEWKAGQAACASKGAGNRGYAGGGRMLDFDEADAEIGTSSGSISNAASEESTAASATSGASSAGGAGGAGGSKEQSLAATAAAGALGFACSALLWVLLVRGKAELSVLLRRWRWR